MPRSSRRHRRTAELRSERLRRRAWRERRRAERRAWRREVWGPDRGAWRSARYARHRHARRHWGLRRRLTFAFAFVALAAVLLTTVLTLGAVVGARRQLFFGEAPAGAAHGFPWRWWHRAQPSAAGGGAAGGSLPAPSGGAAAGPAGPAGGSTSGAAGAESARQAFSGIVRTAFLAAFLAFLLASAAAALVTRFLTRPLVALTAGARRLAAGERGLRLRLPRARDELRVLTDAFNQLTEGLERQERWRRDMVADVAHDLRTPIAVLRSELEAMQDGVRVPDADGLARLHGEVMMLSRLVDDLRALSSAEAGAISLRRARTGVASLLERTRDAFAARAAEAAARLTLEPVDPQLEAFLDPDRILQVLGNLVDNALRHAPGSPVELGARRDGSAVELWVRDHGPGLDPASVGRVFERFYRGDPARSRRAPESGRNGAEGPAAGGSGLGLAIVKALAEAHGGRAAARNHEGGGAVFSVWLPSGEPRA